jgi:hypothetical protein
MVSRRAGRTGVRSPAADVSGCRVHAAREDLQLGEFRERRAVVAARVRHALIPWSSIRWYAAVSSQACSLGVGKACGWVAPSGEDAGMVLHEVDQVLRVAAGRCRARARRIANAFNRYRGELVRGGWTVILIRDTDHMSAMQAAAVLPILSPWLFSNGALRTHSPAAERAEG